MPSKDGPDLVVPDYERPVGDSSNELIQARVAKMILEQEMNIEVTVPKKNRGRWLREDVLRTLAKASWPNMKLIWSTQKKVAEDGGESKTKRDRRARRAPLQSSDNAGFHLDREQIPSVRPLWS
ncbi:hypothetical protein CALVIDRAFT_542274 [Calocera viscosa TUFC12733]|uniref:Uncharacterized protein n=1 Tax=Calocera viscosa (strain TUFC12733) TaxID=1330018 RepID=A0A167GTX4_CALVF|nr:hypothetical protein CALVIDRAFT_542274 [Calocera viscosa TUFC12733]